MRVLIKYFEVFADDGEDSEACLTTEINAVAIALEARRWVVDRIDVQGVEFCGPNAFATVVYEVSGRGTSLDV